MNEENKQSQSELISKYLAGEASPEEAMQLHRSFIDEANKDEYNRLVQIWNHVPGTSAANIPSVEKEWTELEKKIEPYQKTKLSRLVFSRIAVAASIIGLMLIVSYVLFFKGKVDTLAKNNNEENIVVASTEVVRIDTLPDGSVIILDKNSSIAYSASFNEKNRETTLSGQAFFNVVPNKTNPFTVTIGQLKIQVVGTSFNVRNISVNGSVEVQVQSGIVRMFTAKKEITLVKGQTGIYSTKGDLNLEDTIDLNSISYATKSFFFNDLSFVDACRYLEKAFNVIIKTDKEKFKDCRLTAQFNNKSLEYILDVIGATLNSSYKKQGNVINIIGEGCK